MLGFVCLTMGCNKQQLKGIHVDSNEVTKEEFMKKIEALPPNQRWQYVRDHMDTLQRLKDDPDRTKIDAVTKLLPPKGQ